MGSGNPLTASLCRFPDCPTFLGAGGGPAQPTALDISILICAFCPPLHLSKVDMNLPRWDPMGRNRSDLGLRRLSYLADLGCRDCHALGPLKSDMCAPNRRFAWKVSAGSFAARRLVFDPSCRPSSRPARRASDPQCAANHPSAARFESSNLWPSARSGTAPVSRPDGKNQVFDEIILSSGRSWAAGTATVQPCQRRRPEGGYNGAAADDGEGGSLPSVDPRPDLPNTLKRAPDSAGA